MKTSSKPLNGPIRYLTVALFAALALSGCSTPGGGSAAAGTPSSSSTGDPASASASPTPSSGPFGGFASAAEMCSTISKEATGASLLPMSAAQGKTAELEQYKAELAATADRVPDALKADFTNLKDTAIAGLKDQTVYSSGKFEKAMAPVTTWLSANCK
ncbi:MULTISPECIES: hypothetical protein [Arthrobacter]|uniref:Lipoprotein n=2 Tax=Arthrobacter TaxID=1663 RepID=A0AAW8DGP2_9MICC|nr:hypothetical protein [Arthrobacter bambusae]MDP9905839.1 hypothetical protein [Arthrobacter bambusae]MDQ0130426.1 hypothetical protein [Arthrobacter bambusae]MDQ0181653.1 hypothetical protein [Arthrobacter bambusae]